MSNEHMTYSPRPDITPRSELNTLSQIYACAIERYEASHTEKKAVGVTSTNGDDATKGFQISEKEKGGRHVVH
jgi:hypothetical protein